MNREATPEELASLEGLVSNLHSAPAKKLETNRRATNEELNALGGLAVRASPQKVEPVPEPSHLRNVATPIQTAAAQTLGQLKAGESLFGIADLGATMATGMFASAAGGLAGVGELIFGVVSDDKDALSKAVTMVDQVVKDYTWAPRTQSGKDITGAVGGQFQNFEGDIERGGEVILSATGSPLAATAFHTGASMLPSVIKPKAPLIPTKRANVDLPFSEFGDRARATSASNITDKHGLKLDANPTDLAAQIAEAGQRQATINRGDSSASLQQAIQEASKVKKSQTDALYKDVRGQEAGIKRTVVSEISQDLEGVLAGYPTKDMKGVSGLMTDLEKLGALTRKRETNRAFMGAQRGRKSGDPTFVEKKGSVTEATPEYMELNELVEWYGKISRTTPRSDDGAQWQALGLMRGVVKNKLDAKFAGDMIKGDPMVISTWKKALKSHHEYVKTFKEDKVVRDLVEVEATPEMVRQWIVGSNEALGTPKTAGVVKRLNDILGRDSSEMQLLRTDMKLSLLEPLLRETPDVKAFVKRMGDFNRKNNTLAREMMSETELMELGAIAKAFEKHKATGWESMASIDPFNMVGRFIFGHGMAQAAGRQKIGTTALKSLIAPIGHNQRMKIISEMTGLDHKAPLFGSRQMQALGIQATSTQMEDQQ